MSEIILVTGEIESGKTSYCRELIKIGEDQGVAMGGLISPAVFSGDQKIAIDVMDLKSQQRRRLAELSTDQDSVIQTRRWAFDPEAVAWANQVLREACPCDLLLIDELGPLEFERDQGWTNGIRAVEKGGFNCALVVIRPSLLVQARAIWPVSRIIDLDRSPIHPQALFQSLDLETKT